MTFVLPIPLPERLVSERRLVPKHDFMHRHLTVAFGPDGRGYLHSELFYNYRRYDQGEGSISAQLVTLLAPEFSITELLWLEALHEEMTHEPDSERYVSNNDLAPLTVTGRGEVVFCTQKNRTFVYDENVKERLARFDPLRGDLPGFSSLHVVPGGVVALRTVDELCVAVDPGPLSAGLPALRHVTSVETVLGKLSTRGYRGRSAALGLDRVLVTTFVKRGRSGWIDDAEFEYAVLGGDGQIVGRFPLGAGDTPYGKLGLHDDSLVTHHGLGAWLLRSDAALHAFDRNGERLVRLGLHAGGSLAALSSLRPIGAAPGGELLFVHEKHHLLLVTDPVTRLDELEPALARAAAVYGPELKRLKKAVPCQDGRWFGFEAKTLPATAKLAGSDARIKSEAAAASLLAPAPALVPAAGDPALVSFTPHDVAALAAYARTLTGTDAALAEYIQLGVALQDMAPHDPQHAPTSRRAHMLRCANAARWRAQWDQPVALFNYHTPTFCGLPSGAQLDFLPNDLAALDRQLLGLPIQSLAVSGMSSKDIQSLARLPLLRRITDLKLSGSSKHKLGGPLLAWLAVQKFSNLHGLQLTNVATTGKELFAVLATLPSLARLMVSNGGLTPEGLAELTQSPAAAKLEELNLRYTAMGSAMAPLLSRFPALRRINLQAVDLGDDVTASPAPYIAAADVNCFDNPRLGARGLAWLLRALPNLRKLQLPGTLPPEAISELLPLVSQLEALEIWRPSAAAQLALIDTVLPRACKLQSLKLTFGATTGLTARVVDRCGELHELHLGAVDDTDVAACARVPSLRVLELREGANDDNLEQLASTASFPELRELRLSSKAVTEEGLRHLLAAPWPKLERIELMYAQIRNASRLPAPPTRPLMLRLFLCKIPKPQLEELRAAWAEQLAVGG